MKFAPSKVRHEKIETFVLTEKVIFGGKRTYILVKLIFSYTQNRIIFGIKKYANNSDKIVQYGVSLKNKNVNEVNWVVYIPLKWNAVSKT